MIPLQNDLISNKAKISKDWIKPICSVSNESNASIHWQVYDFLEEDDVFFDMIMSKFDSAIEQAILDIETLNSPQDIVLDNQILSHEANKAKNIIDNFLVKVHGTMSIILKNHIHNDKELLVAFLVLFSVYNEMRADEDKDDLNPGNIYIRTLIDFQKIFINTFQTALPLFVNLQLILQGVREKIN